MANRVYKFSMMGIVAVILFGGFMAVYGYNSDLYPLERIKGHLDRVIGSSDPAVIQAHLTIINDEMAIILAKLPETTDTGDGLIAKNPVWVFATESTNFLRIQTDLNTMVDSIQKISTVPKDSSAYHTGMLDINGRATLLKDNITNAMPYMYVSITNILFATIWIAAIMGIFAALKKKKEQLTRMGEVGV